jgi:hypothetical protein
MLIEPIGADKTGAPYPLAARHVFISMTYLAWVLARMRLDAWYRLVHHTAPPFRFELEDMRVDARADPRAR